MKAVYGAKQAAIDAKTELHGQSLMGSSIRIYYGMVWNTCQTKKTRREVTHKARYQHTDTDLLLSPTAATDQYLRVPEIEKNFLLSPPGSPPLDWTQERESAPFTGPHSRFGLCHERVAAGWILTWRGSSPGKLHRSLY